MNPWQGTPSSTHPTLNPGTSIPTHSRRPQFCYHCACSSSPCPLLHACNQPSCKGSCWYRPDACELLHMPPLYTSLLCNLGSCKE